MKRRAPRLVFIGGLMAAAAIPVLSLSMASAAEAAQTYTVRPGDTLSGLQSQLGSSAAQLAEYNHLADPSVIVAGQVLTVPPVTSATPAAYTVRAGDTLGSIAATSGTTVANLASINHIADPNLIFVGEILETTGSQSPVAPAPVPAQVATQAVQTSAYTPSGAFACIAHYESGGNPAEATGNGYYGMYQFSLSSWALAGGTGMPQNATAAEQTQIANNLLAQEGWAAWPNTSKLCGV